MERGHVVGPGEAIDGFRTVRDVQVSYCVEGGVHIMEFIGHVNIEPLRVVGKSRGDAESLMRAKLAREYEGCLRLEGADGGALTMGQQMWMGELGSYVGRA